MAFDSTVTTNPLAHWPRPLTFVFSGGGAYGATQVGMLRALQEAGIVPDLVVGTSVGAINGARFAADPERAVDDLVGLWETMTRSGVFGGRTRIGRAWSAARHGLRRHSMAVFSPERLRGLIDANFPVERLEDLTIPTAVVATDALVGQPKLLTQGPIGPVLEATSALPGIFPPVKIEGCFYIDGGVTANVPVRQAIGFGARSLVVLDANPASMPGTLPSSIIGSVMHASMIMLRNQRADATEDLVGRHPILHLPQVTPTDQNSFDFGNTRALIELGQSSTRSFLERLPDLTDSARQLAATPEPVAEPEAVDPPPPVAADVPPPPADRKRVGL
jgi:NTE family protein